jgi:hypothetical protein
MAEKGKTKKTVAAPAKVKSRGNGKFKAILILIAFCAAAPFCLPTLLICLGLLPALVALITDTDPEKNTAATIGFMNFAGVSPFLIDLWLKGQTWEAAFAILREPTNWMVMLGSAAIGHLILYAVPPVVMLFTMTKMDLRLKKLRDAQEELKAIWGADVANPKAGNSNRR